MFKIVLYDRYQLPTEISEIKVQSHSQSSASSLNGTPKIRQSPPQRTQLPSNVSSHSSGELETETLEESDSSEESRASHCDVLISCLLHDFPDKDNGTV